MGAAAEERPRLLRAELVSGARLAGAARGFLQLDEDHVRGSRADVLPVVLLRREPADRPGPEFYLALHVA